MTISIATTTQSNRPPTTGILGELEAEWDQLGPSTPPELIVWRKDPGPLCAARDLEHALSIIWASPDAALTTLIGAAQAGDQLAGRVIIQAFLPRARRLVAKVGKSAPQLHAEAALNAIEALWELIATYPLDRRPRRIASNIALDLLKRISNDRYRGRDLWSKDGANRPLLSIERPRSHASGTVEYLPELDEAATMPSIDDELAELLQLATDTGVITTGQAELLHDCYATTRSSAEIAESLGIAQTALRHRTEAARRALTTHADELAADLAADLAA